MPTHTPDDIQFNMVDVSHAFNVDGKMIEVLRSINISVIRGEFVALIGPSGCGKTTFLKIAAGLQNPTLGHINIDGASPSSLLKEGRIGFMFQQPVLLRWRTVRENVLLPIELLPKTVHMPASKEWTLNADKLIKLVGLSGFEDMYPHQLSGGMQSRVSLARTLYCKPKILFMDEPFGHLDELTRTRLNFELLSLHSTYFPTIIFVTHSINEAILLADRVVVMSKRPGKVLEQVRIDLPRPRRVEDADSKGFQDYVHLIRKTIANEIGAETP